MDKRYLNYFLIKGNIYLTIGEIDNAIEAYREVLKVNDKLEQAYINIGCAYINNKKPKEGIPYLEKALKLNPKIASVHSNLGNAFYMIGDKEKALEFLNEAQRLDPSISSALSSKAVAYLDSGKPEQAMLTLIKAIEKDPYNSNAYINLAILFRDKNAQEDAIRWLKRGITILKSKPYKEKKIASALANLGYAYLDIQKYTEMNKCFKDAIEYDEDCLSVAGFYVYSKLFVADWKNIEHYKNLALKKISENKNCCTPFCSFSITDELDIQKKAAIRYSADRLNRVHKGKVYNFKNNYKHKKPRVAYISGDFHDHATMHLMAGLFENQNNENFDYYALSYSNKRDNRPITKRVEKCFKNFHHVAGKSNEEIAELINNLEIDIAVDLKAILTEQE